MAKVIEIGKFKFKRVERPESVTCPICRRNVGLETLRSSVVKVVSKGRVIGKVRSVLSECCSTEWLVGDA